MWKNRTAQNGSGEFYHYGIKGMRWGVRRYQNYDGSLTRSGKIRYSPKKVNQISRREALSLIKSGEDFSIAKGSNLYRATNYSGHEFGRLYVSGRRTDAEHYATTIDSIGGDLSKPVYKKTYETTANINVAGIKTVAKELSAIFKEPAYLKISNERELVDFYYNYAANKKLTTNFDVLNKATKERAAMIQNLQQKGYDAAVDIVDIVIAYSDMPLIVLDSEKKLGKTYVEKHF